MARSNARAIQHVLFVCMGNICRSPTAEGVFRVAVAQAGLTADIHVDSAGTHDYHIGGPPDPRSVATALRRGYDLSALRARLVERGDFARFQWILAMDEVNLSALRALQPPGHVGHVGLLLDLAPELGLRAVPDPYYGVAPDFERVVDLVEGATPALLARVSVALGGH